MGADRTISRSQWLRRLASRRQDRTAFVLSGGGPYGALQVGALRALIERGVKPDLVVGTSVGSLNAAFLAFDPSEHGVARLESIWRGMEEEDLFPGARFKSSWAKMIMRGDKVFDNTGIRRVIQTRLGSARFEDARIPFAVVATDIETGDETVFSSGGIIDPLLASCAMPGIYPPVAIGARSYIDGGVSDAVPIGPAVEMGANKIYVINCSAGNQRPRPLIRPMDHLLHAFALARARRLEVELPMLSEKAEIIMVPGPDLDLTIPLTSLAHTETMLEAAYATARTFLGRAVGEAAEGSTI